MLYIFDSFNTTLSIWSKIKIDWGHRRTWNVWVRSRIPSVGVIIGKALQLAFLLNHVVFVFYHYYMISLKNQSPTQPRVQRANTGTPEVGIIIYALPKKQASTQSKDRTKANARAFIRIGISTRRNLIGTHVLVIVAHARLRRTLVGVTAYDNGKRQYYSRREQYVETTRLYDLFLQSTSHGSDFSWKFDCSEAPFL